MAASPAPCRAPVFGGCMEQKEVVVPEKEQRVPVAEQGALLSYMQQQIAQTQLIPSLVQPLSAQ